MTQQLQRNAYNPDLKPGKLAQMILFFLSEVDNAHLGNVKLMNLLYFADFDHFEKYGEPISGARYRKLPQGPVPDDATTMLEQLTASGIVHHEVVMRGQYPQDHFVPEEMANLRVFSQSERVMLQAVADTWRETSSQEIADVSHQEAPWNAVRLYEVIPYHLAYYRNNHGAMHLEEDELDWDDEEEVIAER